MRAPENITLLFLEEQALSTSPIFRLIVFRSGPVGASIATLPRFHRVDVRWCSEANSFPLIGQAESSIYGSLRIPAAPFFFNALCIGQTFNILFFIMVKPGYHTTLINTYAIAGYLLTLM